MSSPSFPFLFNRRARSSAVLLVALSVCVLRFWPSPVAPVQHFVDSPDEMPRSGELAALMENQDHILKLTRIEPVAGDEAEEVTDLTERFAPPMGLTQMDEMPEETIAEAPRVDEVITPAEPLVMARAETPAHIAIIIDDLGMNEAGSRAIIALPAPLSLSFLPYAPNAATMARDAAKAGHEIMLHMPMEPMDSTLDLGPIALRTNMEAGAFAEMLSSGLGSVPGIVGMNNHMGSRLTQDRAAMDAVMGALKERGLFFVDSRTIDSSVAADSARDMGVKFAVRDVFIDHDATPEGIAASLARAERHARANGRAVLIGHPKMATVEALRAWLPTLAEKNMKIVPVGKLVAAGETAFAKVVTPPTEITPSAASLINLDMRLPLPVTATASR